MKLISDSILGFISLIVNRHVLNSLKDGEITWSRQFRATVGCTLAILEYPFDRQECTLSFASADDPVDMMQIVVERWNKQNNIPINTTEATSDMTKVEVAQHQYWDANNEWSLDSYGYLTTEETSTSGKPYKKLEMTLNLVRAHSYYEITLILPVIFLALLSTIGMILPG